MKQKFITAAAFADSLKHTTYLYGRKWQQGTTLLLHGPRDVDSAARALKIVSTLPSSAGQVVYVNTSHSLESHCNELQKLSNLMVFTPEFDGVDDRRDYCDIVIEGIEAAVAETDAKVFVVDSVSRIAALSFGRNASAAYVMKRLVALQVRLGVSMLVLSADSTKTVDRALVALADSEIDLTPVEEDLVAVQPAVSKSHVARFVSSKEFFAQRQESNGRRSVTMTIK